MIGKPILTLCVCSFNRAHRVRMQVALLIPVLEEMGGTIEMVVSNNASTDNTVERLSNFVSPFLRVIHRTEHLPTGEEHVFAAIQECTGEFVWFLGDDDIPNLDTVRQLPKILTRGEDFFIFNSLYADGHGGFIGRFMQMNAETMSGPFARTANALGFISCLPGMSNAIYRRKLAADTEWQDIAATSRLYSHVVWWFRAFKGKHLCIVNKPLVKYRVETTQNLRLHFDKVTKKLGVGSLFAWTLGLIKLLDLIEREGSIPADEIRNIWEFERDGNVFRLLDNLIHMVHEQLKLCATSEYEASLFTREDFDYCIDWLLRMDPEYYDCTNVLRRAYQARFYAKEDVPELLKWCHADFWQLLNHKKNFSNRFINHIGHFYGFDLYSHRFAVVGFKTNGSVDPQPHLRWIDPPEIPDQVLVSDTVEELQQKITAYVDSRRIPVLRHSTAI